MGSLKKIKFICLIEIRPTIKYCLNITFYTSQSNAATIYI